MFTNFKPSIKNSIEYYDSYKSKVNNIINNTEFIQFVNNDNITNQIIFFDKNNKILLKSSYEIISVYLPTQKIWKWSWSVPLPANNTFISRKLVEYACSLNDLSDILIKSILTNSKINISNDIQIDILLSLISKLTKNPFIFEYIPVAPIDFNKKNVDSNIDTKNNIIHYRNIINNKKYDVFKQHLIQYLLILDFPH